MSTSLCLLCVTNTLLCPHVSPPHGAAPRPPMFTLFSQQRMVLPAPGEDVYDSKVNPKLKVINYSAKSQIYAICRQSKKKNNDCRLRICRWRYSLGSPFLSLPHSWTHSLCEELTLLPALFLFGFHVRIISAGFRKV